MIRFALPADAAAISDLYAPHGGRQGQKIGAVQHNLAPRNLNRFGQNAQNGLADHRLARATFSHQPAHFAHFHRQGHIAQQGPAALDPCRQVAHLKKAHRSTGSKRSFNPSPNCENDSTVKNSVISGKTNTHHA